MWILSAREYAFRGREGINLLVHVCHSTLSVFLLPIFSPFLLFLILFFSSFNTYPYSRLWFSPSRSSPLPVHGKVPFIHCLPWLAFTILAFNYLCLVWVSLPTTTGLSAVQPPPVTCVGFTTPHYQTRKIILFACSPLHSYLLWCGCSFSLLYPSWHAPSGSSSSLLLLGGMSSQ